MNWNDITSLITEHAGKSTVGGAAVAVLAKIGAAFSRRVTRLETAVFFPEKPEQKLMTMEQHDKICTGVKKEIEGKGNDKVDSLADEVQDIKAYLERADAKQSDHWKRIYDKLEEVQTGLAGVVKVQEILVNEFVKKN